MKIIEIILLLAFLLLMSTVCHHYIKRIPVSLIQIVLGCGLAILFHFSINLSTDWFLLLFIAPLLFNDGRRFPKKDLWELRWPIFANAIVLVFITMFVGGLLIYKLIPSMPLSAALALTAILSPTDPIALESITSKLRLPKKIVRVVNGEGLINDASGLIGFKYAVAATTYGVFSLKGAIIDFVYISLIGAVVGIITMLAISLARKWLYKSGLISVPFNVVLQIASPFAIYLLSEDVFHASGVIAVVTAGIIYHVNGINLQASSAELVLVSEKAWDIIIYLLNGIVFLILGIELPFAMQAVINSMKFNTLTSIGYAFITWFILLVVRCIWILLYEVGHNLVTQKKLGPINIKTASVVGFSGVRGAITMAGVLSIPLLNSQGNLFPDRDLILFIASMVIILSLLAAIIVLPLIVKTNRTVEYNNDNYWNEEKTRIFVLNYAIDEIKHIKQVDKHIVNIIVDQYELLIRQLSSIKPDALQLHARNLAVDFEHQAVRNLIVNHQITKREANIINYHINHRELKNALEFNQFNLKLELISAWQTAKLWFFHQQSDGYQQKRIQSALIQVNEYTISKLQAIDSIDSSVVNAIVDEYTNLNHVLKTKSLNYTEDYRFVKEQALFAQRNGIQDLISHDKISVELASKLRQEINYIENNELNS